MPKDTFFNLPEKKRKRILSVLLDAFASGAYQDVSIDQIVDQAGISKGSFYQYFEDKQDCYLYLIQLTVDEKIRFMADFNSSSEERDPFQLLQTIIQASLDFQFSNPRLGQIAYRAAFKDAPLPADTRDVIRTSSQSYFENMLKEGIEAGVIRDGIDPGVGAFILNAVFINLGEFILAQHQLDAGDLLTEGTSLFDQEEIHQTIQLVLDALENGYKKNQ